MQNEVNKLIFNSLLNHNSITLPGVGSLSVVRNAAKMDSKSRVVAPSFGVKYTSAESGVSLVDSIAESANISATDANDIYLRWLDKVKADNILDIKGIGVLRGEIFVADKSLISRLNLAPNKVIAIHHRRNYTPYAVAVAVLILVGISAWFITKENRVVIPAPSIPEKEVIVSRNIVATIVQQPEEESIEEEEVQTPTNWTERDDLRHWVVVGSYSTPENAQRAINDIIEGGKAEFCDILGLGKMYAVAVFASDDKAECEQYVRDNRHIFNQSWVHTPKRFK